MNTHEDSEPVADFLVEHLRQTAARIIEVATALTYLGAQTEQYRKALTTLIHVSWTMANSFNSLDDTLKDGGQLPVSWSPVDITGAQVDELDCLLSDGCSDTARNWWNERT